MKQLLTERVADFAQFDRVRVAGRALPFGAQDLIHVYVKLDFKAEHENARNANDARGFLSSVARASLAAQRLAENHGGVLLEVQGSMLHTALPSRPNLARDYAAELHWIYRAVFNNTNGRVLGWRMAADSGRTLVVVGQGVHGDDSFVSLGRSANRPAKYIYAQLELPEPERALKRFHLSVRDPQSDRWQHHDLGTFAQRLDEAKAIVDAARSGRPQLDFTAGLPAGQQVTARSGGLAPAGTPDSPTAERPHIRFGWVMRCDLDGFTARVEACFDNDQKLEELARQFYNIMDQAKQFVDRHPQVLAQLPWAGDNFTAAALLPTRDEYDRAIPLRLVELPLDFEKDVGPTATNAGFGGWAHSVAGGEVHGNADGNVYIGSVPLGNRRFLVGVGEGFGRSAQSFTDISARPKDIVVFEPDWARLDDAYKVAFEPAITVREEQSSLYRVAKTEALVRARARRGASGAATIVTVAPGRSQPVSARPHAP